MTIFQRRWNGSQVSKDHSTPSALFCTSLRNVCLIIKSASEVFNPDYAMMMMEIVMETMTNDRRDLSARRHGGDDDRDRDGSETLQPVVMVVVMMMISTVMRDDDKRDLFLPVDMAVMMMEAGTVMETTVTTTDADTLES